MDDKQETGFVGAECGSDTVRHFNAMCADLPDLIKASLPDPSQYEGSRLAVVPASNIDDPFGTRAFYPGQEWRRVGMGPWERLGQKDRTTSDV